MDCPVRIQVQEACSDEWNLLLVVTDVAPPKSPWDDPLGIHWCPLAHKLVHLDRYHPRPHSVAGAAPGVFSIWVLEENFDIEASAA